MQKRMREFTMTDEAVAALLERARVGRLATTGSDGTPYITPLHFLYRDGKLYFHGLPAGEKLENIAARPAVCFEVDEMTGLLLDGVKSPCSADTAYESVIARGRAALVADPAEKRAVLTAIVAKYAPSLSALDMPDVAVNGTAVVEVTPTRITGKYHS